MWYAEILGKEYVLNLNKKELKKSFIYVFLWIFISPVVVFINNIFYFFISLLNRQKSINARQNKVEIEMKITENPIYKEAKDRSEFRSDY